MKNDFIYDLMRSEEIREYYRKNIELSSLEQECVIINCYKSIKEKLGLLNKLYNNIPQDDQKGVNEMIILYELLINIYYNPHSFFKDDCNIVYVIHSRIPICNLLSNSNLNGFFNNYDGPNEYFNTIEKSIKYMNDNINHVSLFEVEILVIPKNNKCFSSISFSCHIINGSFEPINCAFDDLIFKKYNLSNAIDRYKYAEISHKGLPFENGCKVKFKTPCMKTEFLGVIYSEKDLNCCWYNFVYKDTTKEINLNKEDFLDMSYTNINVASNYTVFDWLERA